LTKKSPISRVLKVILIFKCCKTTGAGFLLTLALITLIGFLASNLVTKRLFDYLEKLFSRLPLVKLLYGSIKDLIGAFVGDKKSFDRPVLVEITPGSGTRVLGFITRDSLEFLGLPGHVAVYFPQSYNFAGNLLIFPAEQVHPLDIDSSEVMAFLVSGGVSGGCSRSSPGRASSYGRVTRGGRR
jgi:uncharacterized membrane protein